MRTRRALGVAAAALTLAACGSDATGPSAGTTPTASASSSSPGTAAFPVEVQTATGSVRLAQQPQRVVSLSPTATETLFAVGAGQQVVAVDDQSDYPAEAPRTDLSGYEPNLEAILGYRPDLVLVPAGTPSDLTRGLEQAKVPVLAGPAPEDLEGAYDQILDVGAATGHREEAGRVVDGMKSRIDELVASVPEGPPLSVFHELGPELYTAASGTFIGRVYDMLGLDNVADEAAKKAGNQYPQLTPEYVVSADPDLVLLADAQCCAVTPEKVADRPGWKKISAVRHGAVVPLDEDVSSRWGPRIPEFVEATVEAIRVAREGEGGKAAA